MSASSPRAATASSGSSDLPRDTTKLELENQSLKRRLVQYAATLEKLTGHARREIDASVRARDDALAAAADAAGLREGIVEAERKRDEALDRLRVVEDKLREKDMKLQGLEERTHALEGASQGRKKDSLEMAELRTQVSAAKREAEFAQEERSQERDRADTLHDQLAELNHQVATARNAEMRIKSLEAENTEIAKAKEAAEATVRELKGKEESVRSERDLFQRKTSDVDGMVDKLRDELAVAVDKATKMERSFKSAEGQGAEEVNAAKEKAKQAEDTVTALRAELDEVHGQLSDARTALEEARVASIAQDVQKEAIEERDAIKANLSSIQDELEQSNELLTRAAIDALADKQRIRKLEDSLYKARSTLNTEREERRVRDQKISQLTQSVQNTEHELDGLRTTKRTLSEECHKLQLQLHEKSNVVVTKSRELEELGVVRADRESTAQKLGLELSNSKNALAKKESEIVNLSAEYQDVCNQITIASKDLEGRHVEIATIRRELSTYKDRVVDLETEAERNKLTFSELQASRRQVQGLAEKSAEKEGEVAEMKRLLTATKNEAAGVLREKKRLSDMLGEVSGDLKRANQELDILRGLRKDQEVLATRIAEMSANSARDLDLMKQTQIAQAEALAKNTVMEYQRKLEEVQSTAQRNIAASVTNQLRDDLMPHLLGIVDQKAKNIVRNLARHVESFAIDVTTDSELSSSKHGETGAATDATSRSPSQDADNADSMLPQVTNQTTASESPSFPQSAPGSTRAFASEYADGSPEVREVQEEDLTETYPGEDEPVEDDEDLTTRELIPGDDADADETVDATGTARDAEGVMSSEVFVMMTSDEPLTDDQEDTLEAHFEGHAEYDDDDDLDEDRDYEPEDDAGVGESEEEFGQSEERDADITGEEDPAVDEEFGGPGSGNELAEDEVAPVRAVASEAKEANEPEVGSETDAAEKLRDYGEQSADEEATTKDMMAQDSKPSDYSQLYDDSHPDEEMEYTSAHEPESEEQSRPEEELGMAEGEGPSQEKQADESTVADVHEFARKPVEAVESKAREDPSELEPDAEGHIPAEDVSNVKGHPMDANEETENRYSPELKSAVITEEGQIDADSGLGLYKPFLTTVTDAALGTDTTSTLTDMPPQEETIFENREAIPPAMDSEFAGSSSDGDLPISSTNSEAPGRTSGLAAQDSEASASDANVSHEGPEHVSFTDRDWRQHMVSDPDFVDKHAGREPPSDVDYVTTDSKPVQGDESLGTKPAIPSKFNARNDEDTREVGMADVPEVNYDQEAVDVENASKPIDATHVTVDEYEAAAGPEVTPTGESYVVDSTNILDDDEMDPRNTAVGRSSTFGVPSALASEVDGDDEITPEMGYTPRVDGEGVDADYDSPLVQDFGVGNYGNVTTAADEETTAEEAAAEEAVETFNNEKFAEYGDDERWGERPNYGVEQSEEESPAAAEVEDIIESELPRQEVTFTEPENIVDSTGVLPGEDFRNEEGQKPSGFLVDGTEREVQPKNGEGMEKDTEGKRTSYEEDKATEVDRGPGGVKQNEAMDTSSGQEIGPAEDASAVTEIPSHTEPAAGTRTPAQVTSNERGVVQDDAAVEHNPLSGLSGAENTEAGEDRSAAERKGEQEVNANIQADEMHADNPEAEEAVPGEPAATEDVPVEEMETTKESPPIKTDLGAEAVAAEPGALDAEDETLVDELQASQEVNTGESVAEGELLPAMTEEQRDNGKTEVEEEPSIDETSIEKPSVDESEVSAEVEAFVGKSKLEAEAEAEGGAPQAGADLAAIEGETAADPTASADSGDKEITKNGERENMTGNQGSGRVPVEHVEGTEIVKDPETVAMPGDGLAVTTVDDTDPAFTAETPSSHRDMTTEPNISAESEESREASDQVEGTPKDDDLETVGKGQDVIDDDTVLNLEESETSTEPNIPSRSTSMEGGSEQLVEEQEHIGSQRQIVQDPAVTDDADEPADNEVIEIDDDEDESDIVELSDTLEEDGGGEVDDEVVVEDEYSPSDSAMTNQGTENRGGTTENTGSFLDGQQRDKMNIDASDNLDHPTESGIYDEKTYGFPNVADNSGIEQ